MLMFFRRQEVRCVLGCIAFGGFISIASPSTVPSVLLIIPFVLIFGIIYTAINAVLSAIRPDSQTAGGGRVRRPRVLAALIAAFPVLLLLLQSIGQLTVWDVATAALLFSMAYIYVSRSGVSLFSRHANV